MDQIWVFVISPVSTPVCDWNFEGSHTGICLYAGGYLTRANLVIKGDILAKDGLEVVLTNSLCGRLGSVGPSIHVDVCADKHAHACNLGWEDDP